MRYVVLALLCTFTACRTGKADPIQTAAGRVEDALRKGATSADKSGPTELRVRYNPAPCDCPPFEVFVYGRWTRAFVDGDSPAIAALQGSDSLAIATLVAVVDSPRRAENGVLYPVVAAP